MTSLSREFIGTASPTAQRAGAGGNPCQGLYWSETGRKPARSAHPKKNREAVADLMTAWIRKRA